MHQVSRKLVNSADRIVFEDLSIQNMLKNHSLAKHIQDVSWGKLIRFTISKAERVGKNVVLVNPYNTSQRCSACGENVPKKLKDRVHICHRCCLIICRDLNSKHGNQNPRTEGDSLWRTDLRLWPKSKVSVGSLKQEAPSFWVGRKSRIWLR